MSNERYKILLTFDVEDWFQVENFKECIPFSSWSSCELRVEKNTHRLLNLLDSVKPQPSAVGVSQDAEQGRRASSNQLGCDSKPGATFFVLGWIAERLPHLVREIHSRGHEVASHGYNHNLPRKCLFQDLRNDLLNSKKLLEDIIGNEVYGYRAPSFSINNDILKIIEDCEYLYDSSFNSFSLHGRYGKLNLPSNGSKGIAFQIRENFYEIPISNLKIGNKVLPWGGGGYFRSLPFSIFKKGMETILKTQNAYLFYLHPWEIDVEQPKVKDSRLLYRIRHYINLDKTYIRLLELIQTFEHFQFISCIQYIKNTIH